MRLARYLLFPFSMLYALVLKIRHLLFDFKILRSCEPKIKRIIIGNLALGGTGKSPFSRYLAQRLSESKRISILSRGYGRKTQGFKMVHPDSSAEECGDEPLEFRFSLNAKVQVAVCEDRCVGIEKLMQSEQKPELILLDDALQHRKLAGGLRILMCTWDQPFFKDQLLPVGNLRDLKSASKKVEILVVSKCPAVTNDQMNRFKTESGFSGSIAFCKNEYAAPVQLNGDLIPSKWIAIAGIADPSDFFNEVEKGLEVMEKLRFKDHHPYSAEELKDIAGKCQSLNCGIITTLKDAMRLKPYFKKELSGINVTFMPVSPVFISGEKELFDQINNYLES